MKRATPLRRAGLFAAALAVQAASAASFELKPGEGYVAIVYDTLHPMSNVKWNFNGKRDTIVLGDDYEAGRHLVVKALPAGRYCLESYSAGDPKVIQNDPFGLCFEIEPGVVNYGGHLMSRLFNAPTGASFRFMLYLSDPLAMIEKIEKQAPEVWEKYRGAPQRYAVNDARNRAMTLEVGETLNSHRAYKEARGFLTVAANLGSGRAMSLIGYQFLSGRGVDQDYAKAAEWFEKGADAGDPRAAALYCIAADLGQGIKEDV
jgi:hypothetical protein